MGIFRCSNQWGGKTFSPFRFLNVLKGCDKLMNYISDEKLKDIVTDESDKELVTIVQTKLEVMQGVSFVSRNKTVEDLIETVFWYLPDFLCFTLLRLIFVIVYVFHVCTWIIKYFCVSIKTPSSIWNCDQMNISLIF